MAKHQVSTPSIKQALIGSNVSEPVKTEIKINSSASAAPLLNQAFTQEQIDSVWPGFAPRYKSEVHLYNTLTNKLQKIDNQLISINVENSVQQDQIRSLKPEIIGFLRRELHNDLIDLQIELMKSNFDNKPLTEDQLLQAMIKKNPYLMKMKSKFNLDFQG